MPNMPKRTAQARWEGNLKEGQGRVKLGSGAFEGQYSFGSRFENGTGTNPEELIGAAHAGCFSMALSMLLGNAGYEPLQIQSEAEVQLQQTESGPAISEITLTTEATVPKISADEFQKQAEAAKSNCPVSKALAGVRIRMTARLRQNE